MSEVVVQGDDANNPLDEVHTEGPYAGSYADRQPTVHTDGSLIFATADDLRLEELARRAFELAWKCEVKPFGPLCPVDWYILRHGGMKAVAEFKGRSHPIDAFPTVFLNVRKWLNLITASQGLGVPPFFCVHFSSGELCWVSVYDIDARRHRMAGCRKRVKSYTDWEPCIDVPVADLHRLSLPQGGVVVQEGEI